MEKLINNELVLRICSALIITLIFFLCIRYNFFPFFVTLIAFLSFFELFRILSLDKFKSFFSILLSLLIYFLFQASLFPIACFMFISCFVISTLLITRPKKCLSLFLPSVLITPFLYTSITLYKEYGETLILFCVFFVVSVDVGGYFVGRFFGTHQLFPKISPKKTYEGLLGSVLFLTLSLSLFVKSSYYDLYKPGLAIIFLLFLSLSVYGDYLESFLKRKHNIKDSGNLIPGHGGVLDRLDALLFSIPAFYFYLTYSVTYG